MFANTDCVHYQVQLHQLFYNIIDLLFINLDELMSIILQTSQDIPSSGKIIEKYEIQPTNLLSNSKKQKYDLLLIDYNPSWREIFIEALEDDGVTYETASDYEEIIDKIETKQYSAICLSISDNWFNILSMINNNYPQIPIILISNNLSETNIHNIRKRYNIKGIIFKTGENSYYDFVSDIKKILIKIIG
ncbi:MAG: response regulator [Desulfococcaceae bacterium]